ncbi:lipoyl(octanoyl) transferase LipB [candidate division KSB1 bacterium]|nr:lipoyl(octanoyl) transferase LipB [candidate division KSB1 bacterium]
MQIEKGGEYAVVQLGRLDVPTADRIMAGLVAERHADRIPDLLLFLSYAPCLAYGARQLDESDLLRSYFVEQGIPIYQTIRGGGLTYHWPGQLICYPLLKLLPHEQNIPAYMHNLEQIGLEVLTTVGLRAHRRRRTAAHIGLWIGNDKIASMGIRIARWVTSYGFALNLSGDVSPARYIKPCGLPVKLTTVQERTGVSPDPQVTMASVQLFFEKYFRRRVGHFAAEIQHRIDAKLIQP